MIKLFLVLLASLSFSYAHADAAKVKDILQKNYPQLGKIEKTNKANILGLYEVVAQGQLFYTDEKAQYLISGNIIDLKTMRNLTEERSHKLFAIDFNSLPFDLAIKKVKGNGQRKMAYFSDPNCGFCKKLENELKNVDNVTLYLFMLSIFQGSDKKVQGVWCSKDQVKAWDNLMLNNVQPPAGTCDAPTAKLMDLSQKLNINGTPALIFADGVLVPGFRPAAELEKSLNSPVTR
ncbi:MAG: DsbC family protein [Candidatus Nitrotoga sp.]|nr:DsbC family protein [Candidatus Nitrotoga sp.]MDO9448683.1 DsbC family protein [Candidatus Nitrotoga sp.]MDP3497800.1 DsbC family protein [Candidatus Nitrotoga sp.]